MSKGSCSEHILSSRLSSCCFCWPMKLGTLYFIVVKYFLALAELSFTVPDAVGSSFPLSSKLFCLLNGHRNPTARSQWQCLARSRENERENSPLHLLRKN